MTKLNHRFWASDGSWSWTSPAPSKKRTRGKRREISHSKSGCKSPGATTFTSHQHDAQKWPWHFGGGNWIRWFWLEHCYYIILYYITLYYIILHYIYYIILYYIILYYIVLYCIVLYYIILYYIILYVWWLNGYIYICLSDLFWSEKLSTGNGWLCPHFMFLPNTCQNWDGCVGFHNVVQHQTFCCFSWYISADSPKNLLVAIQVSSIFSRTTLHESI